MMQAVVASKAVEDLAQNKIIPYIIGGLVISGLAVTYFAIVKPALCMTGFKKCNKDKKALGIMNYKGFDPSFYNPTKVTISAHRAKELADQLYDAGGFINDDEGAFYAALEEAGNAHNLSFISKMFAIRKEQSLAEFVAYHLADAAEVERIKDILKTHS